MSETTPTSVKSTIHIVRRGDLAAGKVFDWDDPDQIAALSPQKRQAWLENPLRGGDEDPVQLVGTLGRRVIGKLDLLLGQAVVNGQPVPMLWTSELYVEEAFRSSLMGVLLVLKMQSLQPMVAACGVSKMALPLFEKLKWRDFPMRRYLALRRSRSVVQQKLGNGLKGRLVTLLADTGLLLHRAALRLLAAIRTTRLECRPLDCADPVQAAALDRAFEASTYQARFHRSSQWVQWVLTQSLTTSPRNQRIAYSVHGPDGQLAAYFMIRDRFYESATHRGFKNLTLGSLVDWAIFDSAQVNLKQIILLAVRKLAGRGVDAIEICLPDARGMPHLRRWGLARVGELHLLVKAPAFKPADGITGSVPTAATTVWAVRPGDGDNAFG